MSDWSWWRFDRLRGAGPGFAHLYAGVVRPEPPLWAACGYLAQLGGLFSRPAPGAPYCSRCERRALDNQLPEGAP